jgi:hypothetical protein
MTDKRVRPRFHRRKRGDAPGKSARLKGHDVGAPLSLPGGPKEEVTLLAVKPIFIAPAPGTAKWGIYVPKEPAALAAKSCRSYLISDASEIVVADWQSFLDDEEQRMYDSLIGLLIDSGISGELKNEYLYLGRHLIGELHCLGDETYDLELSETSFQVYSNRAPHAPSRKHAGIETDGEPLEARQIWEVLSQMRREQILTEAWNEVTQLRSSRDTRFSAVEVPLNIDDAPLHLEVGSSSGLWRVEVQADRMNHRYSYAITDAERGFGVGRRVTDALLEDFSEASGQKPDAAVVVDAIIEVSHFYNKSIARPRLRRGGSRFI